MWNRQQEAAAAAERLRIARETDREGFLDRGSDTEPATAAE
jgi:hypothetical protein